MPDAEYLGIPTGVGRVNGVKFDAFIGGFTWTPNSRLMTRYTFAAGDIRWKEFTYSEGRVETFIHTFLVDYKISKRLTNVFEWTLLNANWRGSYYSERNDAGYGINNELIYRANKRWAFGLRTGVLARDAGNRDWDMYTVGLGANWTPNKWLTVKPEIRHDWTNGVAYTPFNVRKGGNFLTDSSAHQFSGGMSAVVKF
jgi:hypothetical protein